MADPTKYNPEYNFSGYQASNPSKPLPAPSLDNELANIATSIDEAVEAIKDVRRSDGALVNGIVTPDSLSDDTRSLMTQLGDTSLATEAQAEAGTDNETFMSPLRTRQAVDAQVFPQAKGKLISDAFIPDAYLDPAINPSDPVRATEITAALQAAFDAAKAASAGDRAVRLVSDYVINSSLVIDAPSRLTVQGRGHKSKISTLADGTPADYPLLDIVNTTGSTKLVFQDFLLQAFNSEAGCTGIRNASTAEPVVDCQISGLWFLNLVDGVSGDFITLNFRGNEFDLLKGAGVKATLQDFRKCIIAENGFYAMGSAGIDLSSTATSTENDDLLGMNNLVIANNRFDQALGASSLLDSIRLNNIHNFTIGPNVFNGYTPGTPVVQQGSAMNFEDCSHFAVEGVVGQHFRKSGGVFVNCSYFSIGDTCRLDHAASDEIASDAAYYFSGCSDFSAKGGSDYSGANGARADNVTDFEIGGRHTNANRIGVDIRGASKRGEVSAKVKDANRLNIAIPGIRLLGTDVSTKVEDVDVTGESYVSDTAAGQTNNIIVDGFTENCRVIDAAATPVRSGGVSVIDSGTSTKIRGVKNFLTGGTTYDPPSLADGAGVTVTIGVPGAKLGDFFRASFSLDLQGVQMTAWVSATAAVSVRFQNETGGTVDLASGTLKVIGERG